MNEPHSSIAVECDLGEMLAPNADELQLVTDMLAELLKDMLALQDDQEN